MKIIIAPDSFKGSLSALQVANNIEKGVKAAIPQASTVKIPVADGGEGTVQAICDAVGGRIISLETYGPLKDKVTAQYAVFDNTAVIEMASSAGITLIEKERLNPLKTTTYGVGQQIYDAVLKGVDKILIGLGGSATNDGGIGAAAALGVKFFDADDREITDYCGESLGSIVRVDASNVDSRVKAVKFIFACDVKNPLLGKDGCAKVFAPQKGADESIVNRLESGMSHYRDAMLRDYNFDINFQSAGAAGGFLATFAALFEVEIKSGIDTVLDICRFDEHIKDADFVITGEGRIDGQSVFGKVPVGVAARSGGLPVFAIVGSMGNNASAVYDYGITSIMPITNSVMTLDYAIENASELVKDAAERLCRIINR